MLYTKRDCACAVSNIDLTILIVQALYLWTIFQLESFLTVNSCYSNGIML